MNFRLHLFLGFAIACLFKVTAQEIIDFDDLYIDDNNLIHKTSNDSLFSGICEKRRKNNHLVLEEYFENGIIKMAKYYYNGKKKIVSDSVIYNISKPFEYKTIYCFNLDSSLYEKESFDDDGKFILKEEFENEKLIYSCQYNGKKKHGKEFCYSKDGEPLEFRYANGKKLKTKM
ncbi:hypothetical protein [Winogradskyella flava]|uniref:MORN repeat variant n=1 Tax=Winogradskyella flava TaxID=1884876 RepID=A0A842IY17_9FLAO|nr:hypothetical protein [Winogradskyella flava]MBC2846573.1 hypothetical protein [Winogradskyella flava]